MRETFCSDCGMTMAGPCSHPRCPKRPKRTAAMYMIPKNKGDPAVRFDDLTYSSLKAAREARRTICRCETEVAIHVGETHPEILPKGETLWREIPV